MSRVYIGCPHCGTDFYIYTPTESPSDAPTLPLSVNSSWDMTTLARSCQTWSDFIVIHM